MSFSLKDALLIGGLALVSTWTIEYFFVSKKAAPEVIEQKSGQSFIATNKPQDLRPLNAEINFINDQISRHTVVEHEIVETDGARLTFTNQGGTLERLEFKREIKGRPSVLTTIYPVADTDYDKRCFLIALEAKTPYNYSRIERQENDDVVTLLYQTAIEGGVIKKLFTVYKKTFKIDLQIALDTLDTDFSPIRMRIFFPAPIVPDIAANDVISGIVVDDRGSVVITPRSKIDIDRGWYAPTMFGTDDKYFVHAMVHDPSHFTQRAYYHLVNQNETR